jgi:hypothetical protein
MPNSLKPIMAILIVIGIILYVFEYMFCTQCGNTNCLTKYIFPGAVIINSNSEYREIYFAWLVIPAYSLIMNILILIVLKRLKEIKFIYSLSVAYIVLSGFMILGAIKILLGAGILQGYHN